MPRRPYVRIETLQERWQESPFTGGLMGILSVTLATGVIAVACTVIALIVSLIF